MDSVDLSPLQRQATVTQRLLGGLEDQFSKAKDEVADHEKRLVRVENKAKSLEDYHKRGKLIPYSLMLYPVLSEERYR